MATEKRKRAPNFTSSERTVLLSLISNYKHIIENKKTNRVFTEEKNETWAKITEEFNALCPAGNYREMYNLKKMYENLKKEVRHEAAEDRKQLILTGGGLPDADIIKKTDCHELVLSLVNNKTVSGLYNPYDGDCGYVPPQKENRKPDDNCTNLVPTNSWQCEQLTSTNSDNIDIIIENECDDESKREVSPAPVTKKKQTRLQKRYNTARRRPATVVRTLTSSLLAEKYSKLVDKRLELAELEITKIEQNIASDEKERQLRIEALKLDILIKKQQLHNV